MEKFAQQHPSPTYSIKYVNEIKTINDHSQRVSLIRPKLPHPNISNPNSTIDWPDLK